MSRPSPITELHCERAKNFALVGFNNIQIAEAMHVPLRTFESWLKKYPEFRYAVQDGRNVADGLVAASLFNKAVGYTGKDGKWYPPDTTAQIFFLKNRQKALWRDRHDVEHSGEVTYKDLTDDELEHKIRQLEKLVGPKPD